MGLIAGQLVDARLDIAVPHNVERSDHPPDFNVRALRRGRQIDCEVGYFCTYRGDQPPIALGKRLNIVAVGQDNAVPDGGDLLAGVERLLGSLGFQFFRGGTARHY